MFKVDQLTVKVLNNRKDMGYCAAKDTIDKIRELLDVQDEVNMIFAAAPSQSEFLDALSSSKEVNWGRINAFHMDEYIGLEKQHPERFGNFLKKEIFNKVPFKGVFYLNRNGYEPVEEIEQYSNLLRKYPVDIVCMGIGENTHIAFNDPHVADFKDPSLLKVVDLDERSRKQQVHDGCFPTIDDVPVSALTLTVPALLNAKYVFCIVPGKNKAEAVSHTLKDEISERYPSSALREHPHAILYLDEESAGKLDGHFGYAQ